MGNKNFGPAVSGYLNPTGRAWETTVFQAGKPLLDKELNLQQDIDGGQAEDDLLVEMPSGWLGINFLANSAKMPFFIFNSASLTLQFKSSMNAHVNGWLINIQDSNVISTNTLPLTPGPSGNGATRTDLVILEVWRMLLSAAPNVVGKSVLGNIWQNGNVLTDPAHDASLNYPDDIEDSNVGSETTKRVQIQFRLRVIPGIDLFANPYGMNDPAVVANSVPANALSPNGSPTAFSYVNQSPNGDPGLWVAGDGNPANTLGTVDGFMYAIPLTAVFRRNTNAWDRILNQNGGAATPGPSTRPDGFFVDVVEERDLADLRPLVSPTGWDYHEVLTKSFQTLLDNHAVNEWMTNTFGGGGINGATVPWADEIGPFPSDGAAPLIGNFDASRRSFSSRSILETVTIEIPAPGGGWTTGSTVTIDPTNLNIYPYTALNITVGVSIIIQDFQDAWWLGASSVNKTLNAMPFVESVTNVGTLPPVAMVLTVGDITGIGLTNESLFVDLVVAYPTGVGLTKTPVNTYGANGFALTGGTLPAGSPVSFASFTNLLIDEAHREVQLEYLTSTLTITQTANTDSGTAAAVFAGPSAGTATITGLTGMSGALVGQQLHFSGAASGGNNGTFTIFAFLSSTSVVITNGSAVPGDANNGTIVWSVANNTFFRLPERAATIVGVSKNGGGLATPGATLDVTGRIGTLTAFTTSNGDYLTIQYTAIRPLPQNNEQMTIYYDAAAPQAARQAILGTSLTVLPKCVPDDLYVLTTGCGSQDTGYPWPVGYVQTGGIYPNSTNTYSGEADLSGRADIAVADFNASTGFLKLSTFVPMVAYPDKIMFDGVGTDIEGRSYFNAFALGGDYIPNSYAQNLSNATRHKNVLPILCQLSADSTLGFRGQLVLVLLIRYALFDANNSVAFEANETVNTTVASVFRLNMLDKRFV